MALEGGCLCGTVRFSIDATPEVAVYCHCSTCRRAHAAGGVAFTVVPETGFRWTRGGEAVRHYESSPGNLRHFCPGCGSNLMIVEPWNPGFVTVAMGAFDGDPGVRVQGHIFAGSKPPWYEINDGLPQSDGWPEGLGPQ